MPPPEASPADPIAAAAERVEVPAEAGGRQGPTPIERARAARDAMWRGAALAWAAAATLPARGRALREAIGRVIATARARAASWPARRRAAAAGSVAVVVAAFVALVAVRGLRAAPAAAVAAAADPFEGLVPCTTGGGADRDSSLVFGRLGGKLLFEVLRAHDLRPDDVYRVRQAFERIPGFHAPSNGRFVAALDVGSGAVAAFHLVVGPSEVYHARTDAGGVLVGERVRSAPEVRPCAGSMRVGANFADSLEKAPFHPEIATVLDAAIAGRAATEKAEPGTGVRLVVREVRALGAFAGYDVLDGVEIVPAGDSARARRVYRFDGDRGAGYFDASGKRVSSLETSLRDPDSFKRWVALVDARLDAIAWPAPAAAAASEPEPAFDEASEPVFPKSERQPRGSASRTIVRAAKESCSTRIVEGLSRQIIAEARCLAADAFVRVPARRNLKVASNVFLYLEAPARDHLVAALDAHPEKTMTVNSALRTLPQQVLLSKWGEFKRCGVKLAALPGESNHETGLALDVHETSDWRFILEKRGFHWMGRKDPVHFDYDGPGARDQRGLDVRAFQRLWTRNHASDALHETGKFDAATASRIAKSPAAGFPIGPSCGSP